MSRAAQASGRDFLGGTSRAALVSMAGKVAYLATRIALPPLVLRHVGLEEYGLWSLAFVVVGWLGMGSFGVASVYVRGVAASRASGDVDACSRLLSTGLVLTGAMSMILGAALVAGLPHLLGPLGVPSDLHATAAFLLLAACGAFLVELAFGAFANVLLGLERVGAHTAVWVGSSALEAVVLVVLLESGLGLVALPVAFAARLVVSVAASAALCFRFLPGLRVSPLLFDRACLRLFAGYGSVVQAAGLLGIVLYSIEKVIASVFLGPAAAGLFDIGEKLAVMGSGIPASLNGVLLAPISRMAAAGDLAGAGPLLATASRRVCVPAGALLGFLAAFAPEAIVAWMGPDPRLADAAFLLAVFSLAYQAHVTTGPASAWFRGTGRPSRELFYPLVQLALVAAFVASGFAAFGRTVEVVAVTVASAMVASACAYLAWTARGLGEGATRLVLRVALPGLAPWITAAAARAVLAALAPGLEPTGRLEALAILVPGALLHATLVSATAWFLFLDDAEKAAMRPLSSRLRPSPRRALVAGGAS